KTESLVRQSSFCSQYFSASSQFASSRPRSKARSLINPLTKSRTLSRLALKRLATLRRRDRRFSCPENRNRLALNRLAAGRRSRNRSRNRNLKRLRLLRLQRNNLRCNRCDLKRAIKEARIRHS